MLRIFLLLVVSSVCAQQKPLLEVIVHEKTLSKSLALTYTLIKNTGRLITGVDVESIIVIGPPMRGVASVQEFPKELDTSLARIPIPGAVP